MQALHSGITGQTS